jgi:hypothetical protein
MAPSVHPPARAGRHRPPRPRRRSLLTPALVLTGLVVVAGLVRVGLTTGTQRSGALPAARPSTAALTSSAAVRTPAVVPTPAVALSPAGPTRPVPISFPSAGPGTFVYAAGPGKLLGGAGTLHRFRVAVENGMGQDPAGFAATIDQVLGDPRSWIASKRLRLQRVPQRASAEFTIFLATPSTSEKMCAAGGLHTRKYTSCRVSGKVIINVARWLRAVPGYGAPPAVYQAYAINHEVGHQLGHGHEACPGPGRPAPVMQQQTFGLGGCVAYAWPYLNGRRYQGPAV